MLCSESMARLAIAPSGPFGLVKASAGCISETTSATYRASRRYGQPSQFPSHSAPFTAVQTRPGAVPAPTADRQ